MNRRGFIKGLGGALVVGACKGRDRDGIVGPSPTGGTAHPRATSLIGYGLSDGWKDVNFTAFGSALSANGLTLTGIEHVAGAFQPVTVASSERTTSFVGAMRRFGVTTLVNIVNANNHFEIEQPDSWFLDQMAQLQAKMGPEKVILQGVSEPGNRGGDEDKLRRWQRYALERWPGPTATNPGFPYSVNGGTYQDVHLHSEPSSLYGGNTINNSDGPWDPENDAASLARVTKLASRSRTNFLVYDVQEPGVIKLDVLETMGTQIE